MGWTEGIVRMITTMLGGVLDGMEQEPRDLLGKVDVSKVRVCILFFISRFSEDARVFTIPLMEGCLALFLVHPILEYLVQEQGLYEERNNFLCCIIRV